MTENEHRTEPADDTVTAAPTEPADTATPTVDDFVEPVVAPGRHGTNDGKFADVPGATWVGVVILGGGTWKVDYEHAMTVEDALNVVTNSGGLQVREGEGRIVTVDGRPVSLDHVLNRGSVIQITSRVDNG